MNATAKPEAEEILPLVRELADAMARRRCSLEYAVDFIAKNIPEDVRAAGHFHLALAISAADGSPELENWALGRAAAVFRDSATLSRLQASHARMGNRQEAGRLDADLAEALAREGKAGEALAHLARACDVPIGPENSRAALGLKALATACLAESGRDRPSSLSIRRSLRKHLSYLLEMPVAAGDYNLFLLDFRGPEYAGPEGAAKIEKAFLDLVSEPRAAVRERLAGTADIRVLWLSPSGSFLFTADAGRSIAPDASIPELAALCAHFIHPSPATGGALDGFDPDPVRETGASLSDREGFAIRNLGLLGRIQAGALGKGGYGTPETVKLMASLSAEGDRYAASGINTPEAYGRFEYFFCATSGLSNAFLSFLLRLYNPPYPSDGCRGMLGHFAHGDLYRIAKNLEKDGVHVFENRLPDDIVDELVRFAKTGPCYRHGENAKGREAERYPESSPAAPTYDFLESDLIQVTPVQKLMADPCLYAVSQAYFGSKAGLDAVQMWWSAVFDRKPSAEAAQLYHFDLERIQWLKWFVYLTDVDSSTGPHCFVRGSHRVNSKPDALLQRGYQRVSDEDIAGHFPREDFLEITGRKGTVFVEDTSGYHKGKVPTRADRLVLEIQFSNSLFGTVFPRNARIREGAYPPLLEAARARPRFLSKFVLP